MWRKFLDECEVKEYDEISEGESKTPYAVFLEN